MKISFFLTFFLFAFGLASITVYKQGYKEGREETVAIFSVKSPALAVPVVVPEEKPAKKLEDFWQTVYFKNKPMFYSEFASPPLLDSFGIDEAFNYFYTNDGVYAFPVGVFSFEEIYELFLRKPAPVENWGGTAQKI